MDCLIWVNITDITESTHPRLRYIDVIPHVTGEEVHQFKITAELPAKGSSGVLCTEVQSVMKTTRSFACPRDTVGSVVKLQLSENANRATTLCEVEVYGGKIRYVNTKHGSSTTLMSSLNSR